VQLQNKGEVAGIILLLCVINFRFYILTVKKRLKSVYIYGSYRKNKIGVPFFWTTLYVRIIP